MLRSMIAAVLALVCLSLPAEARPHHHRQSSQLAEGCNVLWPCEGSTYSKVTDVYQKPAKLAQSPSWAEQWARPARYIAGRLVCAINVNADLARRGIQGTGSALAKSFLHWGHSTAPKPGAVAVYNRKGGGHVAIVSRVENGRVFVWNPSSHSREWREVEYRKRAIDYRAAL